MINKHLYIMVATVPLLFTSGILQAQPPSFVYRSTLTPPETVFRDGFKSPGKNNDLYDHTNGSSCKKQETAFVATSRSQDFVRQHWAADGLWMTPVTEQQQIYSYRIRATGNFYSVYDSLVAHENSVYRNVGERFRHQEEWVR
ncbi:hypothetical protein [Iodobacter sp. BJB302]|uniref:hypothetical protein n=1 Tax=Iodobacter sp. BJB302 TaxID=1506510 RepID=UPI000C12354F|nr:hypothetical protein [Iodobacter sp. BJB302]